MSFIITQGKVLSFLIEHQYAAIAAIATVALLALLLVLKRTRAKNPVFCHTTILVCAIAIGYTTTQYLPDLLLLLLNNNNNGRDIRGQWLENKKLDSRFIQPVLGWMREYPDMGFVHEIGYRALSQIIVEDTSGRASDLFVTEGGVEVLSHTLSLQQFPHYVSLHENAVMTLSACFHGDPMKDRVALLKRIDKERIMEKTMKVMQAFPAAVRLQAGSLFLITSAGDINSITKGKYSTQLQMSLYNQILENQGMQTIVSTLHLHERETALHHMGAIALAKLFNMRPKVPAWAKGGGGTTETDQEASSSSSSSTTETTQSDASSSSSSSRMSLDFVQAGGLHALMRVLTFPDIEDFTPIASTCRILTLLSLDEYLAEIYDVNAIKLIVNSLHKKFPLTPSKPKMATKLAKQSKSVPDIEDDCFSALTALVLIPSANVDENPYYAAVAAGKGTKASTATQKSNATHSSSSITTTPCPDGLSYLLHTPEILEAIVLLMKRELTKNPKEYGKQALGCSTIEYLVKNIDHIPIVERKEWEGGISGDDDDSGLSRKESRPEEILTRMIEAGAVEAMLLAREAHSGVDWVVNVCGSTVHNLGLRLLPFLTEKKNISATRTTTTKKEQEVEVEEVVVGITAEGKEQNHHIDDNNNNTSIQQQQHQHHVVTQIYTTLSKIMLQSEAHSAMGCVLLGTLTTTVMNETEVVHEIIRASTADIMLKALLLHQKSSIVHSSCRWAIRQISIILSSLASEAMKKEDAGEEEEEEEVKDELQADPGLKNVLHLMKEKSDVSSYQTLGCFALSALFQDMQESRDAFAALGGEEILQNAIDAFPSDPILGVVCSATVSNMQKGKW